MSRLSVPSWPSVLATAEARKERTVAASETRGSCIWDAPSATRAVPGDRQGSRGATCGARGSLLFLEPCCYWHHYRPWPFPFCVQQSKKKKKQLFSVAIPKIVIVDLRSSAGKPQRDLGAGFVPGPESRERQNSTLSVQCCPEVSDKKTTFLLCTTRNSPLM